MKSKYPCIYWNKKLGKWTACKKYQGKTKHLGTFESEDEAYKKERL